MEHYDFIALGGGSAGLTAAKRVRAACRRVALVDPTPIGGLCALHGCNPKKVLVRAIEVLQIVQHASTHGVVAGSAKIHWDQLIARKESFTRPATESTEASLADAGIDFFREPARLCAKDRVQIGERTVSFDGLVIATGSSPRRLEFPGASHVISSDALLDQHSPPARLAIIGAGVVAFEFANVFAALGCTVHVLNRSRRALKKYDGDLVSRVSAHLEAFGVQFRHEVEVKSLSPNPTSYAVALTDGSTLTADVVLNAAGRPANVEGLGLEDANVGYSARGIAVNDYLRSPGNARVFAAGDAHGARELSPVANYEGGIVAHNFLHGDERRAEYSAIPSAVFTVPPLARVGMDEAQAREAGIDVQVVAEELSDWMVYRIAGDAPAHAKVILDRRSGRLVGAQLFGPAADDSIHVFAMAMRYGLTREQLSEMIYVYPSLTSAAQYLLPR